MSARYGVRGARSRDFLTFGGRVIVHDNRAELEFLVKGDVSVLELPRDWPVDQTIALRDHPDFAQVRWPLSREQFDRRGCPR